jgi:hypothetical protein
MATFTVTTSQNIDQITGKTGGDVYNINGGILTIDQHSRFGLNASNTSTTDARFWLNASNTSTTDATSLGTITISATLGGTLNIDGRKVRLIAYTGGSGTLPAMGSLVTQGGASGKIMCVTANHTSLPVTSGTIPASGFIHIKQWNDVEYSAGALTLSGITATSSEASTVGYLEIFGDNASTINANRLGAVNITGEWYRLGTTTGVANQTLQVPNNGTLKHIAGVWIEKNAGAKDYQFYPNAGLQTTVGSEEFRGKACWISNTGLVRLGHNGTANMGYIPPAGREVVIPNVFLQCCLTTARNAEVVPNATIATRYDFTTTGGGVVTIDKAQMAWYPSFVQAYSVQLSNIQVIESLYCSELASEANWINIGVGQKPTTSLNVSPLILTLCFSGGTITNYKGSRLNHSASGTYTDTMTDISGFDFINHSNTPLSTRGHSTTGSINATRISNCNFVSPQILGGRILLTSCTNVTLSNIAYSDNVSGTTFTTYTSSVVDIASGCSNITVDGITLPVTNNQPYTQLVGVQAAGCRVRVRNIGTLLSPLNLGSTNATAFAVTLAAGAAANNVKVQRVYVSNTRTGFSSGDNSSKDIVFENCSGDYADTATGLTSYSSLNATHRAIGNNFTAGAAASVYGTHWLDVFNSATAGRVLVLMNEPSSTTASQAIVANGANFTSAGGLYMPVIGHTATFEMPYYALGHTGFANSALVMSGGKATNYNYNFAIDKNNGAGWSTMTTANYTPTTLGTALNTIGVLDASKGFKLRLKITTVTTNTTAITTVYMPTVSTTTAQGYQYPLDTITLTLNGLIGGSDIVILQAGTETELANVDANPASSYSFVYEVPQAVDIMVYKRGYIPFGIRNYTLSSSDASLPIAQIADRNFLE